MGGLTQLYNRHQRNFARVLGVEVIGAGSDYMNGFYKRRENAEGPPPRGCPTFMSHRRGKSGTSKWDFYTRGRRWYEKDDSSGCALYFYKTMDTRWTLYDGRTECSYDVYV